MNNPRQHAKRYGFISLALALAVMFTTLCTVAFAAPNAGKWTAVRGYESTAGSITEGNGAVNMKGYGGVAYSGSSKTGAAVRFQIVSHPEASYWFSFGIVDKPNAFWKPDGSESHGIVITFTVTATGLNASVIKISEAGMTPLGTILSDNGTINTDHTIAFYKENGNWNIVLDGEGKASIAAAEAPLGDTQYLCAGANADPNMEMKILEVYTDSAIPDSCKPAKPGQPSSSSAQVSSAPSAPAGNNSTSSRPDNTSSATGSASQTPDPSNPGNPDKSLQYFDVVRGYETTAGSAVISNSRYWLTGYGGVSYEKEIRDAVAVQFQLNSIPETNYWFCIGLLDTPDVFWQPDGTESLGLILTLTTNFDNELVLQVRRLSASGYEVLSTIRSEKSAVNTEHLLAIYREDGKWKISLDNTAQALVEESSLDLKNTVYLCAGANGTNTMAMSFSKVYLDSEVTAEMKEVASNAQENLITYTSEGMLKIGDVVQGAANQYTPADNRIHTLEKEIPMMTYILAGLAALAILASVIIWIIAGVRAHLAAKKEQTDDVQSNHPADQNL